MIVPQECTQTSVDMFMIEEVRDCFEDLNDATKWAQMRYLPVWDESEDTMKVKKHYDYMHGTEDVDPMQGDESDNDWFMGDNTDMDGGDWSNNWNADSDWWMDDSHD